MKIGYAVSMLYVVPAAICVFSPRRRTIFIVALVETALIYIALPFKGPGDMALPWFNRPVSTLVLWTVVILVHTNAVSLDRWLDEERRLKSQTDTERSRLRAILDNIPIGVGIADAGGSVLEINDEVRRIWAGGIDPSANKDSPIYRAWWPETGKLVEQSEWPGSRALRGEKCSELFQIERMDGSRGAATFTSAPIVDGTGKIIGAITLAQDVTKLQQTEDELKRSNSELQQFAYVASHDLQEPLRMMISYLSLINGKYRDRLDEKGREYVDIAVEGGERMRETIDDLLAYSRVDRAPHKLSRVDMNAVVSMVLANLENNIKERKAEVVVDSLPTVTADSGQMVQVLQNLVSNGIKFNHGERPRIYVSWGDRPDSFVFSVTDNGIGIDPKYYDRLFQMFQRLHTKEEYPGTGIGLAISKKIVEQHGGRIWVESRPGEGATFSFSIPKSVKS